MESRRKGEAREGRLIRVSGPPINNETSMLKDYSSGRQQSNKSRKMVRYGSIKISNQTVRRIQRFFMAILYSWLLMNSDPMYQRRVMCSFLAARLLDRSVRNLFPRSNSNNGGMSTAEAIAMIQAINSNNRPYTSPELTALALRDSSPISSLFRQSSLIPPSQQIVSDRQYPVPVPVPVPFAVVLVALAGFAAAAAAGAAPLAAVAAAAIAALAAVLAALLVAAALVQKGGGKGQLIKKLVIKKTVLPFVIPIPIPIKKKEKEIIYMPKPVHYHHVEYKEKKKHSYDHMDKKHDHDKELERDSSSSEKNTSDDSPIEKLQTLVDEQNRIQNILDSLPPKKGKSSRSSEANMESNE